MKTTSRVLPRRIFPCLAILALGSAPFTRAQPTSPSASPTKTPTEEEIVKMEAFKVQTDVGRYAEDSSSSGTKIPMSLKEIAGSIEVLNSAAITDRLAQNMNDLTPYVIGMTLNSSNALGFTMRGFDNVNGSNSNNLQVDGMMGITSSHGGVGTANVERVEIMKGPSSVLYGAMQPGGLVQVISKSPKAKRETSVSASVATFAGNYSKFADLMSYTATVDTTGPIDREKHWLYRLIVDHKNQKPFRKGDYQRDRAFYPSLTYQWTPQTFLTVRTEYIRQERRADEGLLIPNRELFRIPAYNTVYQGLNDSDNDTGEAIATEFQTQLGAWTVRAKTRSTWHVDDRRLFTSQNATITNPTSANPTFRRGYRNQYNRHRYNFFDVNAYRVFGPKNFLNTILAGAGGGHDFTDLFRLVFGANNQNPPMSVYNPDIPSVAFPPDVPTQRPKDTQDNLGEYLSDQVKIMDRLHLNLAARHEQMNEHTYDEFTKVYSKGFVGDFVYQVGIVYDVTAPLSVYASWSQSFTPNSITAIDAQGHSGFDPQRGEQYEAGFKFASSDKRFNFNVGVYQVTKTNLLSATGLFFPGTGQSISEFNGEQQGKGIEIEMVLLPRPYWQLQIGYSASRTQVTKSPTLARVGQDLANAPRKGGSLWTRYNVPNGMLKGLGFGGGVIYTGVRLASDPVATGVQLSIPSYTRVDLALYYQWHRTEFGLNTQNLFDRTYIATANNVGTFPGDPRKTTFSVKTRL